MLNLVAELADLVSNGWEGTPPAGDHVVVVSHRPRPEGRHPQASYHFVDDVAPAIAKAKELAGERSVALAAGDVGGQAPNARNAPARADQTSPVRHPCPLIDESKIPAHSDPARRDRTNLIVQLDLPGRCPATASTSRIAHNRRTRKSSKEVREAVSDRGRGVRSQGERPPTRAAPKEREPRS